MASFSTEEVIAEINRQAPIVGVNPQHAIALFMAENSDSGKAKAGRADAVSTKGALGIMQVMPGTARGLQKAGLLPPDWKHDPENLTSGIMAGLAAMKDHQSRMKDPNDVFEMAAGYNGSPAVHKAYLAGKPVPAETADYFRKVAVASQAQGLKIKPPEFTTMSTMTPTESTPAGAASGTTVGRTGSMTTRRNVSDPDVMASFTDSITGAVTANEQAAEAVIAGGTLRSDIMAQMKAAIAASATAKGEEAAATAAIEGGQALRRQQILAGMNLDPNVTANEANRASNAILETDAILTSMKPEIDKMMGVGLLDNPIEWLINQTILPGAVARYNGVVSTQNAAIDRYKQLSTIADGQLNRTAGADADAILRKSVATQQRIAAEAAEKSAEMQEKASAATTRDSMVLAQLAQSTAGLKGKLVDLSKETQTVKEGETEKQRQVREQEAELANVNKTLKAAGSAPFPSWSAYKAAGPAAMKELSETARNGKFGSDFSESFSFMSAKGNINNVAKDGGAAVRSWYLTTLAEAQRINNVNATAAAAPGSTVKNYDKQKGLLTTLNNLQNKYEEEANTDMRTASPGNPMRLDYAMIAKSDALKNNPLAIFINQHGPNSKEPYFAKVDEQFIMQRFAHVVSAGTMSMPDAVKAITDFYKIGTKDQLMTTQYNLFGLNSPQKTYQVQLGATTTGGPAGGGTAGRMVAGKVDLGDVAEVENYLTRLMALRFMEQQNMDMFGSGTFGVAP